MRTPAFILTLLAAAVVARPSAAQAPPGEVTIGLPRWQALERELAELERRARPPRPFAFLDRAVSLSFERGVLRGVLELSVETFESEQPVFVPLLDVEASLADLRLDGEKAVAVRQGAHSAVLIEAPGRHRVRLELAIGREQARFSRGFRFALPPAPVTRLTVDLPEQDLDVELRGGVVLAQTSRAGGTRVEGALASADALDVTWSRRVTHRADQAKELELRAFALVSPGEEMVQAQTQLTYKVLSGEIDRVELLLPEPLEVTRVSGAALLQWHTDVTEANEQRLVVLLRHLVADELQLRVHTQLPLHGGDEEGAARLVFPRPVDAALREAHVAVEGRAGHEVTAAQVEGAEAVNLREVPAALRGLSDKPLLFAYRTEGGWPTLALGLKRNAQLELTQAVIDDLQVSSVLVEQGLEITKMRLYVRNNTRQYLTMALPEGASLTHALIDGVPFHPASSTASGAELLLIPLRQSEKLSQSRLRHHVVQPGDTLSEIALFYFNASHRWPDILSANPGMVDAWDLTVGQRIRIPSEAGGVRLEESNFVIELAYKVQRPGLGVFGSHEVRLPALDIPVMDATWHYHFPSAYEPLSFGSNLQQLTGLRYDPLRRLLQFLERVSWVGHAWAGSDGYSNILLSRKAIYRVEKKREVTEALASFPLIGERFRFHRVLLGQEQPYIHLVYLERAAVPFIRWAALLFALGATLLLTREVRQRGLRGAITPARVVVVALAAVGLLGLGHYVLGVHRHLLWGADLGLALAVLPPLLRARLPQLRERLEAPLRVEAMISPRGLVRVALACVGLTVVLAYPLLTSSFALAGLMVLAVTAREVSHA